MVKNFNLWLKCKLVTPEDSSDPSHPKLQAFGCGGGFEVIFVVCMQAQGWRREALIILVSWEISAQ